MLNGSQKKNEEFIVEIQDNIMTVISHKDNGQSSLSQFKDINVINIHQHTQQDKISSAFKIPQQKFILQNSHYNNTDNFSYQSDSYDLDHTPSQNYFNHEVQQQQQKVIQKIQEQIIEKQQHIVNQSQYMNNNYPTKLQTKHKPNHQNIRTNSILHDSMIKNYYQQLQEKSFIHDQANQAITIVNKKYNKISSLLSLNEILQQEQSKRLSEKMLFNNIALKLGKSQCNQKLQQYIKDENKYMQKLYRQHSEVIRSFETAFYILYFSRKTQKDLNINNQYIKGLDQFNKDFIMGVCFDQTIRQQEIDLVFSIKWPMSLIYVHVIRKLIPENMSLKEFFPVYHQNCTDNLQCLLNNNLHQQLKILIVKFDIKTQKMISSLNKINYQSIPNHIYDYQFNRPWEIDYELEKKLNTNKWYNMNGCTYTISNRGQISISMNLIEDFIENQVWMKNKLYSKLEEVDNQIKENSQQHNQKLTVANEFQGFQNNIIQKIQPITIIKTNNSLFNKKQLIEAQNIQQILYKSPFFSKIQTNQTKINRLFKKSMQVATKRKQYQYLLNLNYFSLNFSSLYHVIKPLIYDTYTQQFKKIHYPKEPIMYEDFFNQEYIEQIKQLVDTLVYVIIIDLDFMKQKQINKILSFNWIYVNYVKFTGLNKYQSKLFGNQQKLTHFRLDCLIINNLNQKLKILQISEYLTYSIAQSFLQINFPSLQRLQLSNCCCDNNLQALQILFCTQLSNMSKGKVFMKEPILNDGNILINQQLYRNKFKEFKQNSPSVIQGVQKYIQYRNAMQAQRKQKKRRRLYKFYMRIYDIRNKLVIFSQDKPTTKHWIQVERIRKEQIYMFEQQVDLEKSQYEENKLSIKQKQLTESYHSIMKKYYI